ncbi:hypothetical protein KKF84_06400 [Myxococcota bacterium]|nr:hypothetical protein [Myxococcota bacterium]
MSFNSKVFSMNRTGKGADLGQEISVTRASRRVMLFALATIILVGVCVTGILLTSDHQSRIDFSLLLIVGSAVFDFFARKYTIHLKGISTLSKRMEEGKFYGRATFWLAMLMILVVLIVGFQLGYQKPTWVLLGAAYITVKLIDIVILMRAS